MYKCIECDTVFEEGEEAEWEESRGEFWGVPCFEKMTGCPKCKGDYGEVIRCEKCKQWCFEDDLTDGLCECCYDEEDD